MKPLINFLAILSLSLGVQLESTAQEREAKKALDAFINATTKSSTQTPAAGAEVSPQPNATVTAPGKGKGIKQGKGSAVKTGDSYQGEVRHF